MGQAEQDALTNVIYEKLLAARISSDFQRLMRLADDLTDAVVGLQTSDTKTKECFRCHRIGVRGFTCETTNPPFWYACTARSACQGRKLRYLRSTYPHWGK